MKIQSLSIDCDVECRGGDGKGRDLIGVHTFAQLQGTYVAGKTRSQVESALTG